MSFRHVDVLFGDSLSISVRNGTQPESRPSESAEMSRPPRVLFVDDDEPLLRALTRSLRTDATIFTATKPVEARKLSVEARPDVAIVDLVLGEHSGIELIGQLKGDRPELVVVAYSAHLTNEVAAAADRAGAALVEPKTLGVRDLLRRVIVPICETSAVEQFYQRLVALDETNVEPLLADALRLLVEIAHAELAYLELFDEEHVPRFWRGYHVDEQALETIRTMISRGIVGRAIADGETIETRSAFNDARFAKLDSVRRNEVGAVLCVPIRRENTVIGVMYLQGNASSFSMLDRERAEVFASQLARVAPGAGKLTLEEEERGLHARRVREAMLRANWNVSEAARELRVSRNFIYTVMARRRR